MRWQYLILSSLLSILFLSCKSVDSSHELKDISTSDFHWQRIGEGTVQGENLEYMFRKDASNYVGMFYTISEDPTAKVSIIVRPTTDAGKTWQAPSFTLNNVKNPPDDVFQAPDGTLVFLADNQAMMSTDNGRTWQKIDHENIYATEAAFANPKVGLLYSKTFRIIQLTRDGGKNWESIEVGSDDDVRNIGAFPGGLFIHGTNGKSSDLKISTDEGKTWTTKVLNADFSWTRPKRDNPFPDPGEVLHDTGRLILLDANTMFRFVRGVGIFRSLDGGKTFPLVLKNPPPVDKKSFAQQSVRVMGEEGERFFGFANKNSGVATGKYGYIQVTQDGGETWKEIPTGRGFREINGLAVYGNYVVLKTNGGMQSSGINSFFVSEIGAIKEPVVWDKDFQALPAPQVQMADGSTIVLKDFQPWESMLKDINLQKPGQVDYSANADAVQTPDSSRKHLPALTILNAMDEVRAAHHKNIPEGQVRLAENGIQVTDFTVQECLNNDTPHWSDLMMHYYCQFGSLRGCYTGQNRGYAEGLKKFLEDWQKTNPGKPADFSQAIQQGLVPPKAIRQTSFQNCQRDAYFDWLKYKPQRAEVFQAIMFSQVMEYSEEEQQAIINAFYGRMKPASQGPFDIEKDCNTYRPLRHGEVEGQNRCYRNCAQGESPQTHRCKVREVPLKGAGR